LISSTIPDSKARVRKRHLILKDRISSRASREEASLGETEHFHWRLSLNNELQLDVIANAKLSREARE
jgi:hypothetical protein